MIAAINGPTSVVLSGDTHALGQLHTQLENEQARARLIPVDYAAHSPQVEAIRSVLLDGCLTVAARSSELPFYSAVTGAALDTDLLDGEYWYRNLREPVQFELATKAALEHGCHTFIEISPHPVLVAGVGETAERMLDAQLSAHGHAGPDAASVGGRSSPGIRAISSLRRGEGGPLRFSKSLAEAWVHGVHVDWGGLYARSGASRVSLPTYAFQRRRYWLQMESSPGDVVSLGLREAEHPLLGAALAPPEGEGLTLTGCLSLGSQPWLADHAVFARTVVSGTTFVELALHAGALVGCPAISELTLETPLILEEQDAKHIQLVVGDPDEHGSRPMSIYSRDGRESTDGFEPNAEWTRNASATLVGRERMSFEHPEGFVHELAGDVWPPVEAEPLEIAELYERVAEIGLEYGPAFRGLRRAWRRGPQIFAEVSLPEDQSLHACAFRLHPALLDAAVHAYVASLVEQHPSGERPAVRLPFSLNDVTVDLQGASSLRVCLTSTAPDLLSLVATDERGAVVADVRSLALRPLSDEQLIGRGADARESLFRLDWVVAPVVDVAGPERWVAVGRRASELMAALAADELAGISGSCHPDLEELGNAIDEGEIAPESVLAYVTYAEDTDAEEAPSDLGKPVGAKSADAREPQRDRVASGSMLERAHSAVNETLELIREWLADERFATSRLVLITSGAIAVRSGAEVELAQSPVWGLIRSAQAENPGRLVLADLDGVLDSWKALAGALAGGEPQLAIREGVVYAARLLRAGSGSVLEPPAGVADWRLEVGSEGTLDGLHLAACPQASAALAPNEVRVAVRAAGVNFRDVVMALGLVPQRREGEETIGSEGAGIVLEVGSGVQGISPGDRVMGLLFGAFGSTVVVDSRVIVGIPDGWSYTLAASISGAFLTAWFGLVDLAGLKRGERVLVHAATGGVGMAAVQIAKHLGAEVWGTASPRKWDTLRKGGLDDTHISSTRDLEFRERFLSATDGQGVDVVLNSLAREYVDASLDLLGKGGRFIEMGKTDIRDPAEVANTHPGVEYRAFDLPEAGPERIGQMLVEILGLFQRGVLEPLPVSAWDVRRARDAFRFMSQARHVGKLVLTLPVSSIDPGGTALITGGMGKLGTEVARHLVVAHGMRNLVIASRRGEQAEGAKELLAELTALGADVRIAACDVSRREHLSALLDSIATDRPLSVVVHSAAVLDDGVIDSLTPERIERVFAPKLDAAWHLHELTEGIDLQAFILFSSISGTFGTPGQGSYAAANAFLDALAVYRQSRGLPAVSMAWGGWEQRSEMTARLSEADVLRVRRAGVGAFSSQEGLELFDAALGAAEPAILPVRLERAALRTQAREGILPRLLSDLVRLPTNRVGAGARLRERIGGLAQAERGRTVLAFVRDEVAAVLGHSSAEAIGAQRAFKELGFDSLLAVELRNRLNAATGLRLPATLIFDHPTPSSLADHVLSELDGVRAVSASSVSHARPSEEPVAIVGMSCRYPGGARSPRELWDLVAGGVDGVGAFPFDRGWDLAGLSSHDPESPGKSDAREGGFVHDAVDFDADFFGISPREALAMDPQQRLLLEASWEALEDAGIDPHSLRGSSTGVFAGVGAIAYGSGESAESANVAAFRLTGTLGSVASGRIAYTLGLEGPALSIDTACSSSLVAMHLACGALRSGESSLALAGGVTVMATPDPFVEFTRQRGLARDGRCKSFANSADGAGWGEGVGMLVLERLSDARRNGHRVYALVRGSAVNQDGASNGLTAPNGPSQQRVILQALANAGLSAADVDAVEAHGTGTTLGDPIEAQALLATYGQGRDRPLWLGSIKSNIGHTQLAAGAAGVIKMTMALQHELLPRTLHVDEPSQQVDWSSGSVCLLTEERSWPQEGRPRRAGVSSFGVSGTNAHVIIEEAPALDDAVASNGGSRPGESARVLSEDVLPWVLSANGSPALREHAARLRDFVLSDDDVEPADVGASLARRSRLTDRAVVIGENRAQMVAGLAALSAGEIAPNVIQGSAGASAATLAFLFTGQGAQRAGMGRELYRTQRVFAEALDEVCHGIDPHLGQSLQEILFSDDGSSATSLLDETMFTQAALFALEASLFRLLESFGVRPDYLIGHSIGELTAAFVAGVFSLEDACRLVVARGRLMGELPSGGAMVALEASEQEVLQALARGDDQVALAAVNGPSAVVVSGERDAVLAFGETWSKRGRKVKRLRVSHAFHSPRMDGMLEAFGDLVGEMTLSLPRIPIVSNLTGEGVARELCSPEYWVRHVRETVCFADGIGWLCEQGVDNFLEVGPDGVLAGMAAECVRDMRDSPDRALPVVVASMKGDQSETRSILSALAEIWARGVQVDWAAMLEESGAKPVRLPTYPFQRQRYWLASSPVAQSRVDEPDADQWPYAVHWLPIDASSTRASSGVWPLVLPGPLAGDPWAAALIEMLNERGVPTIAIECDEAPNRELEDLHDHLAQRLSETFARSPEDTEVAGIISLQAIQEDGDGEGPVPSGLTSVAALAKAVGSMNIDAPLWLVTRGAMSVGPSDPIDSAVQAHMWGFGMTYGLEHPDRWGGLIDLPVELDRRIGSLLAKMLLAGEEDQIAVRSAGVFARRLARSSFAGPQAGSWKPPGGTILITGGTGALGAHVGRWLAREGAEHLLLLTRRGDSAPGAGELRVELERHGAQVTIAACDVADRGALSELIGSLGDRHPLRAVVHAAGAGGHGAIASLTVEDFEQALAAKARGAHNLDALTAEHDLSAFVLFSSIAGTVGSGWQAPYAAANAYLDALATDRCARGLPATSIAWGPWDGEGMAANEAGDALRRYGLVPLPPARALDALASALSSDRPTVAVADIRWDRYAPVFTAARPRPLIEDIPEASAALQRAVNNTEAPGARLRERLRNASGEERLAVSLELVRAEVAHVLGHASSESVHAERAFKEIGFDSLMAVELRNRLELDSALELPATLIFDYPSPITVARYLAEELVEDAPSVEMSLRSGLAGLEAALASLEDVPERRSVAARLRVLLSGLEEQERRAMELGEPNGVAVGERVSSASDEEMFDFIDRELGSL